LNVDAICLTSGQIRLVTTQWTMLTAEHSEPEQYSHTSCFVQTLPPNCTSKLAGFSMLLRSKKQDWVIALDRKG
jgi:hypothetical protein